MINLVKRGRTHRAVVLLLQQGGDISSDGHLLGQILVLHADPPPELLQETQQTRPALGTRLQVGSANAHISVGATARLDVGILAANVQLEPLDLPVSFNIPAYCKKNTPPKVLLVP